MFLRPLLFTSLLWCAVLTTADAQDSLKVIIVSPRVGPEIDAAEREKFYLFTKFTDFSRAIFYLLPDSTIVCGIQLRTSSGVKDTSLSYSEPALLLLAEKINHYEGLMAGSYQMGSDPAKIEVVGGYGQVYLKSPKAAGRSVQVDVPKRNEILPFGIRSKFHLERFPNLRIGFGYSSHSVDLGGLERSFRAIEDLLDSPEFPIAHRSPHEPSGIWLFSVKVRFSKYFAMYLETGRKTDKHVAKKTVSVSGLFYPSLLKADWMRPFVGAGVGNYHISGKTLYGDAIDNNYNYLDEIKFAAGGIGYVVQSGIDVGNVDETANMRFFVNYHIVPAIKETLVNAQFPEGVPAKVRLSSLTVGALVEIAF